MEKVIMMPFIRMAKVVFVVAMFWPAVASATDFVTINSGDWFDPTVWSPTPYPFNGDNATISNNTVSLTFYNALDLQLNDLNLVNGGLSVYNNVGNLASLSMAGTNSYWTNGGLSSTSYGTYGQLNGVVTQLGMLRLMGTNTLGGDLINRGTIRQTDAGALRLTSGAVVNSLGSLYDFAGDGNIIGSSGGGTFTNEGTLLKSSGVNTSTIMAGFINQGGMIEVDSGTLVIQSADPNFVSSNGTFIVGTGATLDLTGGGGAYWRGEITGSGAGQVVLRSGSLNASSTLTLNFPDGLFQWTGGSIGSVLTNLGVITLSGANMVSLKELVNAGLFRHTNTAALSTSQFENLAGGTYDVEDNGQLNNGTFENFGLFRKSGGVGVFSMNNINFYNYGGTIEVDSGTLEFALGSGFFQTNGVTRLEGGNISGSQFNLTSGILTGIGSVTGTVLNTAAVIPGNGGLGTLQIVGNYQQNNGGALDIALGGTNTGQFGQLIVSGSPISHASLAGTLNLSPTNNFTPAIGDQFQILSCSNLSGTFSLPPTFPTGMEITYSNNGVFLTVTGAVNWPAQLSSPTMGNGNFNFGFQTVSGQNYTVQTNDDLTSSNWGDFTNIIGDGSAVQFAVPATNVSADFFRLREP